MMNIVVEEENPTSKIDDRFNMHIDFFSVIRYYNNC